MAMTVSQNEGSPALYPLSDFGLPLSDAAQNVAGSAWTRIEAYVDHRWTERDVEWIVEGEGHWMPPLQPAILGSVHVWEGSWAETTLPEGPYGYCLPGDGPYRVNATVGAESEVPEIVFEAHRRLAEYLAETDEIAGATQQSFSIGGSLTESYERSQSWAARALINCGAADLLRPYRRAK